ncbi:MAG: 4-hydroxy-tetrahydrodipicolinate reductase [bacterium]
MIKVLISGVSGRMGTRIAHLVTADERTELCGGMERSGNPGVGQDIGDVCGLGKSLNIKVSDKPEEVIPQAEVIIDFTAPPATMEKIRTAALHSVPMVIGTTGFSTEQLQEIKEHAQKIPCVLAPNMSVGVNLLLKVLAEVAKVTGDDYDVELVEAHHHHKKDAPSGTALRMAEVVAEALNRDLKEVGNYGRHGLIGERDKKEIGIHTVRGGDIVGTHTMMFAGIGETIEITHRAQSRDTFAQGAVKAAKFVVKAQPGFYDMQDVLNLRI